VTEHPLFIALRRTSTARSRSAQRRLWRNAVGSLLVSTSTHISFTPEGPHCVLHPCCSRSPSCSLDRVPSHPFSVEEDHPSFFFADFTRALPKSSCRNTPSTLNRRSRVLFSLYPVLSLSSSLRSDRVRRPFSFFHRHQKSCMCT